jgi:xanthine dehydrogenase YagS FAD-binding subunit
MQLFGYQRAQSLFQTLEALRSPGTVVVAGGTEMLNWMKEGITAPTNLLDINDLEELNNIRLDDSGLYIGSLARMSDVARHEGVRIKYPAISQALLASASPQLRNMASIGGNLLQRTRCPYYRAETELPCNKRHPGSGCSALEGEDRTMALFGWSDSCIATNPSDLSVALSALEARVRVRSATRERFISFEQFHRLPGDSPHLETSLEEGELITAIEVPASAVAARSHYLKLRERASYEFALVSVATGVDFAENMIREARISLGGVAHKPWRLKQAEKNLNGLSLSDKGAIRRVLDDAFIEARPRRYNDFKIELGKRAVLRALRLAGGVE